MYTQNISIPNDKASIARLLHDHGEREESRQSITWAKWDMFDAYMSGARRFEAFDARGGRVDSFFLDKNGRWQPQIQEILVQMNKVQGVLKSLDFWPSVRREGDSLAAIRERASAQLIASAITSSTELKRTIDDAVDMYTRLGCVGLHTGVESIPGHGLSACHRAVHPREILPFPSLGRDRTKHAGTMRWRWLDIDYLASIYGNAIKSKLKSMEAMEKVLGDPQDETTSSIQRGTSSVPRGRRTTHVLVKVRELWMHGPRDTCTRYCAGSLDTLLEDIPYADNGQIVFLPLTKCSFLDDGTFYGAGYCDILFSITREFERIVQTLINQQSDLEKYPVTLIPHGMVHPKKFMKEDGFDGLRFAMYEPEHRFADPARNLRPVTIAPHGVGVDMPGRTSAFLLSLVDRHSLVADIVRDKGRIDSLPALQYLDEQAAKPLSNPVKNISDLIASGHRYATAEAASRLARTRDAIPVGRLDLGLVGVIIDFNENTVSFHRNPLPDITRLNFGVASSSALSASLRKQEAALWHEKQVIDADTLKLYFVKEGVEVAMWLEPEIAAYRTVVLNILSLYGDGVTPGTPYANPYLDRPDLQLRVLNAFMSSPEMRAASPAVVDAFILYRESLENFIGRAIPQQIPDPIDLAILAQSQPRPQSRPQPTLAR